MVIVATEPTARAGVARGAAWSSLNAAGGVALPFLIFILFARWLEPTQVGLAVLASSLAEIIKAFGFPGLYEALLQQGPNAQRHNETASAALLLTGLVLACAFVGVLAALGPWIPGLARTGWALDFVGLRILFDLATVQPQAALALRFAFGRMATRAIIANSGAGAIGILVAMAGYPFQGLIAYLVAQSVLVFATTVVGTGALAVPRLHFGCLREMRPEASAASVVRLVAAVNNYLDQVVVAGMIGSARLAYFNLGKRVETTFITAAASFSTILFQPLFSRQTATRAAGLKEGLAMLTVVCGAPAAFMVANSDSVVGFVFGNRWREAAPVAAILAVSGFARALGSVHGALLSVSRRNRQLMWVTCVSACTGIGLVLVLASSGIEAVAAGLAVKNAAIAAWMAFLTRRDAFRLVAVYARTVMFPWIAMIVVGFAPHLLAAAVLSSSAMHELGTMLVSGVLVLGTGLLCTAPLLALPPSVASRVSLSWLTKFRRSVETS
jgi:O-antigen/teichoic acid export membrane protein